MRTELPPGTWDDCVPEGTPLQVIPRHKWGPVNDRQRKGDKSLTQMLEDQSLDLNALACDAYVHEPNGYLRESAPNLMSTFKRAEEAAMTATPDHAPYGFKADGTPKKSNGGRKPKTATVAPATAPVTNESAEIAPETLAAVEADLLGGGGNPAFAAAMCALDDKIAASLLEVSTIDERIKDLSDYLRELDVGRHSMVANRERLKQARDVLVELAA